jgi:hypothetical protein
MILDQSSGRIAALTAATLSVAFLVLVLVLPSDTVLAGGEMVSQFVSSRAYLVDSLRHGYLPLWNPFTYVAFES